MLLLTATLLLGASACSGDDGSEQADDTSDIDEAADDSDDAADDPGDSSEEVADDSDEAADDSDEAADDEADDDEAEPDVATYDFSAISPVVEGFVVGHDLNGAGLVVVHRDDGVIHSEYWGEFGEDRISLIASSSKMITAGVLLRLHDDGLLDIDAPVAEVVDWGAGNPDITPAQLISNSSGLVGLLPDPAYTPYLCQFIATGALQPCAEAIFSTPDDDGDIVPPDSEFRYGGGQWQVAGAIAELASGKPWAQLIDEIYVQPCGLDVLAYNNHFAQIGSGGFDYPTEFDSDPSTLEATDNPSMEGGVYATTGDYAKLLLMHLRGGQCDDNQILSSDALSRMHTDRIAEVYGGDTFRSGLGYGMGWWVNRENGRLTDGGAYGSVPWLDLDDGYGAYLVIEADSATGNELAEELYDLVETAVTAP